VAVRNQRNHDVYTMKIRNTRIRDTRPEN